MIILVSLAVCAAVPARGFSEDKSAGFYAGPLSVAATTVVEVAAKKPVLDKRQQQAAREMDFVAAEKIKFHGSDGKEQIKQAPDGEKSEGRPHGI